MWLIDFFLQIFSLKLVNFVGCIFNSTKNTTQLPKFSKTKTTQLMEECSKKFY